MNDLGPYSVRLQSVSAADDLGYRGQLAVSQAVDDASGYLIVGGHMVRLLQAVYPTPRAVPRSTIDADTALEDVKVVGRVTQSLVDADFTRTGGNPFIKDVGDEKHVEVNSCSRALAVGEDWRPGWSRVSVRSTPCPNWVSQ